jgi:hypothetical protein
MLVNGVLGGGASDSAIVRDTFTRADSAITLGSAETGQAWSALAGTWGISSNKAYLVTDTGQAVAVLDAGVADYTYTIDLTTSPTASRVDCGIVFRATDNNNYLLLALNKIVGANTIKLWKNSGGAFGALQTVDPAELAENTLYAVRAVLNGNSIVIQLNGVEKINYTLAGADATAFGTPTKLGIRVNYGALSDDKGSRFDNVLVNP